MSKSDVSASSTDRLAKVAEPVIQFQLEDKLHDASDSTVKVKNVTKFPGIDFSKYKIVGYNDTKSYDNISHHVLSFMIRDKKTKKVDKIVMEFLKKPNEEEYTGVVTSVVGDIKNNPFQLEVGKTVKMSSIKENNGTKLKERGFEDWFYTVVLGN
jgi:hypothetical protein